MDGFAHSGILRGAKKILRMTKPILTDLLNQYPEYSLVVTGHSLGAGTAILISMEVMLGQNQLVAADRVECVALAPPPGL